MIKFARSGDVTEAVTEDGVWQYHAPPTPHDNTVKTRIHESRWSLFIGCYVGGNYCEIRPSWAHGCGVYTESFTVQQCAVL